MHMHTDVRAHKSTVGCILDLPSPTSQPPLFKRAALTDFHMKRCLHRPTQSPLKSLKSTLHPPPPPILSTPLAPRPVNPGLCPEHSPGSQPQPLNEWTRDRRTVGERSRNCSYQPNVVKLICSSRAATRTCHTFRLKSITLYAIYNSYAITLYENTGHSGNLKVNNSTSSSVLFQHYHTFKCVSSKQTHAIITTTGTPAW